MSREEVIAFFKIVTEITEVTFPVVITLAVISVIAPLLFIAGSWLLSRAENAITGLALAAEDGRKKKRDEYDAHYDALLSQPEQDPNIAYYDDDAFSHLTNK